MSVGQVSIRTDYKKTYGLVNQDSYGKIHKNPYMAKSTFGSRLKEAREEKALSMTELGKLVGVSQATISNIESDIQGSSKHAPRMAALLGVSLLWLMDGEGPKKPKAPTGVRKQLQEEFDLIPEDELAPWLELLKQRNAAARKGD